MWPQNDPDTQLTPTTELRQSVAGGPLLEYAERAATDLLEPGAYRNVVLGAGQ